MAGEDRIRLRWKACPKCGRTFELAVNETTGEARLSRQRGCETADECSRRLFPDFDQSAAALRTLDKRLEKPGKGENG